MTGGCLRAHLGVKVTPDIGHCLLAFMRVVGRGCQRLTVKLLATGLLLVCTLSACQPPNASALTIAVAQRPQTLDPRYATDAASERLNRLLYQRLVEFDAASRPIPGIARWQMLSPTQFRFQLTALAARFHDGQALTMHDVQATYQSVLDAADSPHRGEFDHIARMQVVDANTLDITLSRPDPQLPARLIIGILPAKWLALGASARPLPMGSGPFRLEAWQPEVRLQRVRDGLMLHVMEVKDPNVRVLKLKSGEVDLIQGDLPPELVRYCQQQTMLKVSTRPGANYSYLGLNTQAPFLNDIRVRQALAYAIDTRQIVRSLMVPHSRPATAILPPEHYAGNPALQPVRYRPQFAKQLLLEAGVVLPLRLVYKTSTDAQRVRLATVLQAQMQVAGIELQIKSLDWGTFYADVQAGNFQLYGLTWVGIKTPDIYEKVFASQSIPPLGLNRGRYQDARLDALLRDQDWPAVTQHIHQQLPDIPLWYEGQFAAYSQRVQAYVPAADGNWDGLTQVRLQ